MIVAISRRMLGLWVLISASAASAGEMLVLANGHANAPAHNAGVALSSLIKMELLPNNGIDVKTLSSDGPIETVGLLRNGDADIAILPSAIGHTARLGIGSFHGNAPATGFRAVAGLWLDALHLIIRADDVKTGTIDDVAALTDPRMFFGDASTGMIDANRLLFADLGMDAGQPADLAPVRIGDEIQAIKRGDIDALSVMAMAPEPMFNEVFEASDLALRILDVDEDQLARVNGNHWLWTPFTIPVDTYPGQNEDIATIALSNLLVVRTDIGDDVVYALTKSVFENLAYLEHVDPVLADLSLETALAGVVLPLHPGALRYYQETGLIPTPAASNTPSPPAGTPLPGDDDTPLKFPTEHYPDEDVATAGRPGIGGPLLPAAPDDDDVDTESTVPPAERLQRQPQGNWWTPPSHWRRRAML